MPVGSRYNRAKQAEESVLTRLPRPVFALLALVLYAAQGQAQVDCDRYPAGGASRADCYQREYLRARQDLRRAYDAQQRNDATWRRREREEQRLDRAPDQRDPGAYRFNRGEEEDEDR